MRKDLALALLSALLGVAIGYMLGGFQISNPGSWAILVVLVLAMLSSLIMIGPLGFVLRSSGLIRLAGKWRGLWQYQKEEGLVTVQEEVVFRQYGQYLTGKSRSIDVAGPSPFKLVNYKLRGRVTQDGVLHGQWWTVEGGRRYRGVFQGRIHIGGGKIGAAWIGVDNSGVRSGTWTLERN